MRVSGWRGAALFAVAGAGVVGTMLWGASLAHPAEEVRMTSGAAWLASAQVGQLTLLDGSSAEVAAQVKVAAPGDVIDLVQHGTTAYAVNHSTGTISRVDGGTFQASQPIAPIADARGGLVAFAGADVLHALDADRGVLVTADGKTMATTGQPQSLAARLAAGGATMDSAGRLWVVDDETGDLAWIADGKRHTRRGASQPGRGQLAVSAEEPVLLDTGSRTVTPLDPSTGDAGSPIPIDLRERDSAQLSGSPHDARAYVVSSRGVLIVCDLAESTCDRVIPIGDPASDLGAAVEVAGHVLVPDYRTSKVWIVDLATSAIHLSQPLMPTSIRFQLLTRDGVAFYNDPASELAGVLRLDGAIRPTLKYDPKDPDSGLKPLPRRTQGTNVAIGTAPASAPASTLPPNATLPSTLPQNLPTIPPNVTTTTTPTTQPPIPPQAPPVQKPPAPPVTSTPAAPPAPSQPAQSGPPLAPPVSQPVTSTPAGPPVTTTTTTKPPVTTTTTSRPPTTTTTTTTKPPTTPAPPPPPPPPAPNLLITVSNTKPVVGETIALRVDTSTGVAPTSVKWTFADGGTDTRVSTTHSWSTAGPYQVSVTATMPSGPPQTRSTTITVTAPTTVTVPNVVAMRGGDAEAALEAKNLPPAFEFAPDNVMPRDSVIKQYPAAGTVVAPGTTVIVTVSTGPKSPVDLIARAGTADWNSWGESVPPNNPNERQANWAVITDPTLMMDGRMHSPHLLTEPDWAANGFIQGTYLLPSPVIPGDHFRAEIGFHDVPAVWNYEADFIVAVITPRDIVRVASRNIRANSRSLSSLDIDLSDYAGATGVILRVEANGNGNAEGASWIFPRIGP